MRRRRRSWGRRRSTASAKNVEGKKYLYVPAASYEAYEKEWASVIGQGYTLEDISDQELTDGVWYRVSREEKWTTTMPDTFSALYVRTVGEQTISAEALQSVVARLAAQSAPRRSISARPTMFPPNSLPCWPVMRSWAESVSSKIRRRSPTGLSKGVRR